MADVSISYKGNEIASMNATGVKTLLTSSAFCEDDITVTYTKPAAPVPSLQTKSATYTPSTSQQTASITADAGYDALGEVNVTVNAMPSGSASTPATTITANPTISVSSGGLITASVSASQSVTPTVSAGYVSSGTAGTITVSGSNTQQLSVYAGAHHQPSYTVTVSLTNPSGVAHFGQVVIYEAYDDDPDGTVGTELGTILSASGSTTITVPGSVYGIYVVFDGSWIGYGPQYATKSATGGVSYANGDGSVLIFSVFGDGTATVDGVDWEEDY